MTPDQIGQITVCGCTQAPWLGPCEHQKQEPAACRLCGTTEGILLPAGTRGRTLIFECEDRSECTRRGQEQQR